MPVQLAQPTRLQRHDRRGNIVAGKFPLSTIFTISALRHLRRATSFREERKRIRHHSVPAEASRFSSSSGRGNCASKINNSFFGTLSNVDSGTPKFFANTSFGVCVSQSVSRNV